MAAERLHGDDTTVPVLARGRTATGRLWVCVRDDRPFAGGAPPAALFRFSRDRRGEHPEKHLERWSGVLQADAYAGFRALHTGGRSPGPIHEALCWGHARRKFFELADIAASARRGKDAPPISPIALEAVTRIDAIFDLERAINGTDAEGRRGVGQRDAAPLVADLEQWMRTERAALSRHAPVAKAMDYMLRRWDGFARFPDDGRVCLSNNAAERAPRGIALGRKAWLFAGSDRGGDRAAFMYTLIVTAKLNDIDPQAWLADILPRIADTPRSRLPDLLPWASAASRGPRPPPGPRSRPHSRGPGRRHTRRAGMADNAVAAATAFIFPNQDDRGAHVNISGAGVLATAPNRENAIAFLEYLVSDEAQRILADGNNEYPAVSTVEITGPMRDLTGFVASDVNASVYGTNAALAVEIWDRAGVAMSERIIWVNRTPQAGLACGGLRLQHRHPLTTPRLPPGACLTCRGRSSIAAAAEG